MIKAEIVAVVASKTGESAATVRSVIDATFDQIKKANAEKESVFFRGFGTFTIKHRAEKTARNIQKNETIIVPAKDIPYFKPCEEFKKSVL